MNISKYYNNFQFPQSLILYLDQILEIKKTYEIPKYDEQLKEELNAFICDCGLNEVKNELMHVSRYLFYRWWLLTKLEIEFSVGTIREYDNRLAQLKELFLDVFRDGKNLEIEEIKLSTNGKRISLNANSEKKGILNVDMVFLKDMVRFFKVNDYKDYLESEKFVKPMNYKKLEKRSYIKEFVQTELFPLYNYLKNETTLSKMSNKQVYVFIEKYTQIIGIDWNEFISEPFHEYLRKRFFELNH